jgi:hypothetical protein
MKWLTLILSLPTENATARMRAWRALKASGAAVLRDGVYLVPHIPACRTKLENIAADVQANGGTGFLMPTQEPEGVEFEALFSRDDDYAALLGDIARLDAGLTEDTVSEALKQLRKLRKACASIEEIDFFPGEAQKQADAALLAVERRANQVLSPDEPNAAEGDIPRLSIKDYQGQTWATRKRPWVDRLASAWLIRRYIDPEAKILWLESPTKCPPKALGFDFDGATFTHVGAKVTFEVIQASFGLEMPALNRLGALVHYLDAGGIQPPEAAGVESVLAGLRNAITDDDELLQTAFHIFDGLIVAFQTESQAS